MAAKKTRKRAYIPPTHEVVNRKERAPGSPRAGGGAPGRGRGSAGGQRAQARAAYQYPEPGLKRTVRRLPVYFLLIFGLQAYLLTQSSHNATSKVLLAAAGQALIVTVIFAPFMHVMDRFAYNRWQRKNGAAGASK